MTAAGFTGASVRVAHAAEVPAAGALTAEAYLADGVLAGGDDYESELRDAARRAREATLLVAVLPAGAGQAVVGTVTAVPYGSTYAELAEPGEWELRMLAVAPEARRQGVATHLVLGALREAVAGGAHRVVLSTLESMVAARRLYEQLGFREDPGRDWQHEGTRLRALVWSVPARPGAIVERATWPPLRTVDVDGWQVGLSGGVTQRANSALTLAEPPDVTDAIASVAEVYAAEQLPPTFRIDADSRPIGLGPLLTSLGYRTSSMTEVMVRDLPAPSDRRPAHVDVGFTTEPDAAWLTAVAGPKGADPGVIRGIVTGAPAAYLTAVSGGRRVGTARVAFAQDWAGLAGVGVDPGARRTGVARALTATALDLAASRGARRAFLQVESSNQAAIAMYSALGFRPADRYAYLTRD